MNENYVKIATFTYETDMLVFLATLESEGIRYFTFNQFLSSLRPAGNEVISGIKVMVHKEYLEEALEILKNFDFDQSGKFILDVVYKGIRYKKTKGFCPECDENSIYHEKLDLVRQLRVVLKLDKRKYYCNICKNLWEQ